ncbi:MAG TPA: glutaconate CoA-transferase [Dehalococcoidia bacterium]|nr:glutaconate CoA-transferase [Dehalococcoidia bacterium]
MGHLYTTREQYAPEQLKEMKDKYRPPELVCCIGSREVEDREVVFVGIGISDLAGAIAKLVHTPNAILVAEAGYIGFPSVAVLVSPADNSAGAMAMCHQSLPEVFIDQQAGFIDAAYLGFAQMDKYGNVNVSYITGPQIRMNGSGGGGDIASSAGRVVYTVEFNPRQWVEKVDYMTEPGFLDGSPDARKRVNLVGGGPSSVVTERGVFRFAPETHELFLAEVFPWQDEADIEDIKQSFPWDLKVAGELKIIEPPTERELWALGLMDPTGQYVIANIMDRPLGKIIAEGKFNLEGYNTFLELSDRAIREVLDFVS